MINASRSEPQLPFAHLAREASRPCAYPQKHTVTPPIESSSTDGRSHCAGDVVYNGQREFISASGCESSPRIYVDYSNPTSYEATPPPNIMLPNLAPSGKYSGTTRCAKSMDTESRAKGMGTSSRNSAVGVGGGCSFSERVCAEERGYRGRDYGKVREQVPFSAAYLYRPSLEKWFKESFLAFECVQPLNAQPLTNNYAVLIHG